MGDQQQTEYHIEVDPVVEDKIRNVFELHDMEQNDSIPCCEVLNAFRLIPGLNSIPETLEQKIRSDMDTRTDPLSWNEFRHVALTTIDTISEPDQDELAEQEEAKEDLKEAFRTIAKKSKKNKNKKDEELCVDFPMVKHLLKLLSGGELPMPEKEMDDLIKKADTDQSGTIEIDEFVEMMMGDD